MFVARERVQSDARRARLQEEQARKAQETGELLGERLTLNMGEREKIYNLVELLSGARFTTNYTRVGGHTRDLPEPFIPQLREFLTGFKPVVEEADRLLTRNRIFIDRCKDVGVISKSDAIAYAISGPNLRDSGIEHDVRRKHPYLDYQNYDFEIPIGTVGDAYDRYLIRMKCDRV